ncbi:DNA repair protein RecN [Chloroflexia bacterium SDU3-3]|nr:DNA repair protein RecN [Chloroflexia bacterium SDU3-3]
MLLELNISDFAIIDRLNLRLTPGFNALTGETGAGKSIIIDALGTLRGERADPSFVRAGAERARIEGVFSIGDTPAIIPLLQEYGLWEEDDETIILVRELSAGSGRSVARINGRAVNSGILREVGGQLVDIHGQHEGLSLFNTRTHGEMLDRYGQLLPLRGQVGERYAALRSTQDELSKLRAAAARRTERIEELQLLLDDVRDAKLRAGEEQELLQERALVQNGARITDLVSRSYALLYAGQESGKGAARSIIESMGVVNDSLAELGRLDPSVEKLAELAAELLYTLEDLSANVRAYRDSMEFDSARLDAIEDRLTLIREMQRKHHGTVEEILDRAARATEEIDRLTHSAEHMADLEAQEQRLREEVGRLAAQLSQRRREVGNRLGEAVVASMRDLAMPNVRFQVSLEQALDPRGVPARLPHAAPPPEGTPARYACDKTGIDRIEFMLSPNPGEPLKPLAKIASGGESARLLLALKSILSKVDEVPTLIFDEVDVGVGGRAGHVVGEKLWGISAQHQVICITHLPQVAAFGDSHYAIAKQVLGSSAEGNQRTRTKISQLSDDQRVDEIAAMLDGVPISEHSRNSAREMLERADQFKQRIRSSTPQLEMLPKG